MRPGVEWLHERRIPRPAGVAIHYLGSSAAIGAAALADRARARSTRSRRRSATVASRHRPRTSPPQPSTPPGSSTRSCSVSNTGSSGSPAAAASSIRRSPTAARRSRSSSGSSSRSRSRRTGSSRRSVRRVSFVTPRPAEEREADHRDLGSDRREARRLRAWTARDDHVRQHRALDRLLAIGLPYWLLIGVFAGHRRDRPCDRAARCGLVAIGAGLTVSWQTGALAAAIVYGFRLAPGLRDRPAHPRPRGRTLAAGRPRHRDERRPALRRLLRAARDSARRDPRDARRRARPETRIRPRRTCPR